MTTSESDTQRTSEDRPIQFTVQSAIRNLGLDLVAALLTAGLSETSLILVGSPGLTKGVIHFSKQVLPENVDVDSLFRTLTKFEYMQLTAEDRQKMAIHLWSRDIINSAFTDEQLRWLREILIRANMISNQQKARDLIHRETMKLRTTLSMLRHLAARGATDNQTKSNMEPFENETTAV